MTNKYTEFRKIEGKEEYEIWNIVYNMKVGAIRKERMGQWMHWQLFQYSNCGFSNGCLKEVSNFITNLYRKK